MLYDIACGNGVFVAVGDGGKIVTSLDSVSWTVRNSRTDERLRGIAFGNGTSVAFGYAGTVVTSKVGFKWRARSAGPQECLQMITCNRGTFVTVGWKGILPSSPDGWRWTVCHSGSSELLEGIAYRDGYFAANVTNRVASVSACSVNWAKPLAGEVVRCGKLQTDVGFLRPRKKLWSGMFGVNLPAETVISRRARLPTCSGTKGGKTSP